MQFQIVAGTGAADATFNPASAGATIRSGATAIARLANPVAGTLASGVTVDATRQLTLNEVLAPRNKVGGIQFPRRAAGDPG